MRLKFLAAPLLILTLGLGTGGCAPFLALTDAITTSIPVGQKSIVTAEASYRSALILAQGYRDYCYSKPLVQLPSICKPRRKVIRAMWAADNKAYAALVAARQVGSTLNINTAIKAVDTYVSLTATYRVN